MVSKTFVYNDLVSLMPHMIGFDRVLQQVQNYHSNNTRTTPFPPYNIRKVDEFNYQVEMAVMQQVMEKMTLKSRQKMEL